ncbi:unnamed protein product [Rotaria sordida]|uniref:Uncharacterized protein n=1 Tax=Rotaria sordida TaxID=392033 RepID=A0A819SS58_9BILA|nr:unnamed protein product [Rotaria sordida]
MAPQRATAKDVFTSVYNGTGFPFAYVCCIGILSTIFSFSGYEAGAHMAEETRSARRAGNADKRSTSELQKVKVGLGQDFIWI